MATTHHAFEPRTLRLPVSAILPTKQLSKNITQTAKFQTILVSIRELGIVEPLAVYPENLDAGTNVRYILLDGHMRFRALVELGVVDAICIIATDDEGFTYNRQINRISAIQEHRMILAAIKKGVSPERIAQVLNVNVDRIRQRQHLLDGIAPEVVTLLKDKMVGQVVFTSLRKMKPMRQIEAAEMMIAANRFTGTYAEMILATTRTELLVDGKKIRRSEDVKPEDIARMEREMEKLHQDYVIAEDEVGETMLTLVVAKGYIARLLRNEAISSYLSRRHHDIFEGISGVMDAIASDARVPEKE
jgi:hypothetical protein